VDVVRRSGCRGVTYPVIRAARSVVRAGGPSPEGR